MNERIGIVVSQFNSMITDIMLENAIKTIKKLNAKTLSIVKVPGVFEIPFAIQRLVKKNNIDGVIALGCAVKGKTSHDKVIVNACAIEVMSLMTKYNKPITFGVIGPDAKMNDAKKRPIEYADHAASTVVTMLRMKI